uniref:Ras-related protein Rab-20-like isoform X2 n=1 Tax=Petromyzon marinus TaxID=7757 RepID=A0AAJ7XE77_PETMA|nr:ras-related protein Rab-20-like isoform X2 [Petromyzon marinus]
MSNRPDFKVVLLGDVSVGKTSLLRRYAERRFEDTVSTVGGTFVMREWAGHTVALWDTAGKERFHGLGSMFCRGARAVLLVYDVTSRASFAALEERFLGLTDSADAGCIFALVGNKADLLPPPPSLTLQSDGSPGALAPEEEEHRRLREAQRERTCPLSAVSFAPRPAQPAPAAAAARRDIPDRQRRGRGGVAHRRPP